VLAGSWRAPKWDVSDLPGIESHPGGAIGMPKMAAIALILYIINEGG